MRQKTLPGREKKNQIEVSRLSFNYLSRMDLCQNDINVNRIFFFIKDDRVNLRKCEMMRQCVFVTKRD